MPWIFLAVLALSPACVAAYITFSTINLREGITFQHNLTTGQITINSPDQRNRILFDFINNGNISANIGGVTTYYNLSDPFIYRQTQPPIEVDYCETTFNSTYPAQNGSNGWFQVDDTRYSLPYGEIGTESPIAVNMQDDVLKLETSMADVEVERIPDVFRTSRKWKGIETFTLDMPGTTVMIKYPGENRTFVRRGTVINYNSNSNMIETWTSKMGSYVFDLKARTVKYTTHAGRVYNLSNYYRGEKSEIDVKFGVDTVRVSNRGLVCVSHVISGEAVYTASLYNYTGGNMQYHYFYDLNDSTVRLMKSNKTVITVHIRNMTVEGSGLWYETYTRADNVSKNPQKMWLSVEFDVKVEFYGHPHVKIDGLWKVEILESRSRNVISEHGHAYWLYMDDRPTILSYWKEDQNIRVRVGDDVTSISINELNHMIMKNSITLSISGSHDLWFTPNGSTAY